MSESLHDTGQAENADVIRQYLLAAEGVKDKAGVPINYHCATVVASLSDLSSRAFQGKSAVIMPRRLDGDFDGLAVSMNRDIYQGNLRGELQSTWQRSVGIAPSWLGIEAVRRYATQTELFGQELSTILADMEFIESLGRTPLLKVYTYDYDDETVDRPHVDPYTPNYETGERYTDRFITVYNSKVTRHVSHEDVEPLASLDSTKTFRLKPGARVGTFHNGDIWRQACGDGGGVKPFIHWSATEYGDEPKLILTG
ncbi:MAG: hypothetical protein KDI90_00400 [Alphaproteobacteria bacterium]|nr:hypothetical protein [Alphaproteobacteria bacterium]MCB9974650.1 hypothetical protein [Rhodospirillales bacterium]